MATQEKRIPWHAHDWRDVRFLDDPNHNLKIKPIIELESDHTHSDQMQRGITYRCQICKAEVTPTKHSISQDRAAEIWAARKYQHDISGAVTLEEDLIIRSLWERLPGNTSYMDAFFRFRDGRV